jgi:hypothetical protein
VHIKFFHNTHHTQLHKKRSTDTYTGRCENMWLILKRNRKCQCHILTSCWWRFAHFWIGARLNHYQYHLICEPGCHRASFISNSQLDFTITIVCSFLVFKNPRKFLSNGKKSELFNLIFWFLKTYGWWQLFKS